MPNQFSNPANPEIHRRTTAEEIWRDLEGKVDVFVAAFGTGGTITGCGERLKERNPDLHVVAVEPALAGAVRRAAGPAQDPGIGPGFVPEVLNREVIDEIVRSRTRTPSSRAAVRAPRGRERRDLGGRRGVGSGPGRVAPEMRGKRIVAIIPDSGERYVSTPFFAP